jgi:hypothetical protein
MWGIRFRGPADRREQIGRRMEIGAVVSAVLLAGGPIAAFLLWWWRHPPGEAARLDPTSLPWAGVTLLSVALVSLLVVGRWFRRLGSNSDIEELRKAAFAYRLGGTLALRPFLTRDGQGLRPESRIEDYETGIEEPTFLKNVSLPSFLLAVLLALALGLLAFSADRLDLAGRPSLLLGGPLAAQGGVLGGEPLAPEVLRALVDHQAGALLCLAFAFLGALLWSITYLSRRMALRDVTGHAYQTIALRLLGAAIVALFVYHTKILLVPGDFDNAQRWDEVAVLLVAFAAGVVPEVALRWLAGRTRRLFGAGAEQRADELELEMIEGIDAYTRVRLAEAGIHDAQGLVAANPLHLTLRTPFSLPQVIDWIGQACLLVQLKPDLYRRLRAQGLRTAWQLDQLVELREGGRLGLAEEAGGFDPAPGGAAPPPARLEAGGGPPLPPDRARTLLALLEADPAFVRAGEVARCMRAARERLVTPGVEAEPRGA